MFYFILLRVVRLSSALKTFTYVLQVFTISHWCVCKCACVSDLLLESHSFQRTGPESMAINLHDLHPHSYNPQLKLVLVGFQIQTASLHVLFIFSLFCPIHIHTNTKNTHFHTTRLTNNTQTETNWWT